ncbi:MAG: SET domain-containing protein-lysine N-methyltransferase [Pirellulaceae bacterium]|nr:SET domain-containing protein-lysine N-methyltransferase [Pirellulaceae bacterium]
MRDILSYEDERFEIRTLKSGAGRGVFALVQFKPGQLVMEIHGQLIDEEGYSSLYCMDLGEGRVLEPGVPGALVNHSCDPNCQLVDLGNETLGLEALVNIEPGRELTYNYGWTADVKPQACYCGSPRCLGYIIAPKELPKLLKKIKKKKKKKAKKKK